MKARRGVTLVELIVALGLLVVVLGAVGMGIVLVSHGHVQGEHDYDLRSQRRIAQSRFDALGFATELSYERLPDAASVRVDSGMLVFTYDDGSVASIDCVGAEARLESDVRTGVCRLMYTVYFGGDDRAEGFVTLLNMDQGDLPTGDIDFARQALYYTGG